MMTAARPSANCRDNWRNKHRGGNTETGNRSREAIHDYCDDGSPDQRSENHSGKVIQHIERDESRHDSATDIDRDSGFAGAVAGRDSVSHPEMPHYLGQLRASAFNFSKGNVDVASEEARKQCHEGEMRRQSERLEDVADDADPNEHKPYKQYAQEQKRVEDQE